MAIQTYTVTGMSCSHCEHAVTEEVTRIPGVTGVRASAADGVLTVDAATTVPDADVIAAVEEAGYEAVRA